VTRVDHRPIGNGTIGPVALALRARYLETTGGRVPKYRAWCRAVYAASTSPIPPAPMGAMTS
jgi:hypothetical protein